MFDILKLSSRKNKLLEQGWYENIEGNFVHPHLMRIISIKELIKINEKDFCSLLRL